MYTIAPNVVDKLLTPFEFHSIVTQHLKKYIPVRVRKIFDTSIGKSGVCIGGTYHSEYDRERKKCIEVVFEYRDKIEKIKITNKQFLRICNLIADAILHEIMHMRQFRRRKFKTVPDYNSNAKKASVREEQNYLGCADEIDAYGFNIACELTEKFKGDKIAIIKYLGTNKKDMRRKYDTWKMYLKAFDYEHEHKIIKRLKLKVIMYLDRAKVGKPYQNKKWIDY
jgi:hypothetical protein